MDLPFLDANRAAALVSPVLFGFTAATQFDQIGGHSDGMHLSDLAISVADAVQTNGCITGTATRTRSRLVVLVGVPVAQVEVASGRSGLVAVFGAVASRKPAVPDSLSATALDAVPHVLSTLYPGGGLTRSLNALTHDLQHPEAASGRVAELNYHLKQWTHGLTALARSATRRTVGESPATPSTKPALVLAQMLHAQVLRTRRNQLGTVRPFDSVDETGRLSAYQLRGQDVYVCHCAKRRG